MERRTRAFGLSLGVQRARRFERARVDREDRVETRSLLVVGVDAIQIQLNEPFIRQCARGDCGLDIANGGGQQIERTGLGVRTRRGDERDRGENNSEPV